MSDADDAGFSSVVRSRTLGRSDVRDLASAGPVHLIDCDLAGAGLEGLELVGWKFERCELRHIRLAGATMEGTTWRSCRAGFCNMLGVDLTEAVFVASDLSNGVLHRSKLIDATFTGCRLTGVDLTESRSNGLTFEETLLVGATAPGLSFRKGRLKRLDLSQADLRGCDFRDAVFEQSSLREADVRGARFAGADLRDVDLGGLGINDAWVLRGATISSAQAGGLLAELGLIVG